MHEKKEITGLALGGGAVLGSAHIGVLRALNEDGIRPDMVSGTSIGALVAAFYAFGMDPDEIAKLAIDLDWLDVSSLSLSKMGLLSNEKLGDMIVDTLGDVRIEDANIPLYIVATDLSSGEKVVFNEGNLGRAVMASTCIPGIFIPVEQDGRILADGALVENTPVTPLIEAGSARIIAVDINTLRLYERPDDIIEVIINAMDIAMEKLSQVWPDQVDLLIRPELSSYSRTDTEKVKTLIEEGYRAAREVLDQQ